MIIVPSTVTRYAQEWLALRRVRRLFPAAAQHALRTHRASKESARARLSAHAEMFSRFRGVSGVPQVEKNGSPSLVIAWEDATNTHLCEESFVTHDGLRGYRHVVAGNFVGPLAGSLHGRFALTGSAADALHARRTRGIVDVHWLVDLCLTTCATYASAVRVLCDFPLITPAFFTVVGVTANEVCVIERTPHEYWVRHAGVDGIIQCNSFESEMFRSLSVRAHSSVTADALRRVALCETDEARAVAWGLAQSVIPAYTACLSPRSRR